MLRFAQEAVQEQRQPSTDVSDTIRSVPREKLESLEALRGIAALLVVFYHLQDIFVRKAGIAPLHGFLTSGDRGVDIFFVLSGFIIAWAHAGDIGKPSRMPRYLYRRACRIYPSVWVLSLAAIAVYLCRFGGAAKAWKLGLWHVVASTTLLPQSGPPLVNVTWTLTYEMFFYILFSTLILDRAGILLLLAWQVTTLLVTMHLFSPVYPVAVYYLRPICLEFGIGMVCAWLLAHLTRTSRADRVPQASLIILGAISIIAGLLYEAYWRPHGLQTVRYLVYGLGSGVLILGLILREQSGRLRVPGVLVRLGGASYAIYLVHFSVLSLTAAALLRTPIFRLSDPVMLGCATAAVAVGVGFHQFVDQPIQMTLRRVDRRLFRPPHSNPILSPSTRLIVGTGMRPQ